MIGNIQVTLIAIVVLLLLLINSARKSSIYQAELVLRLMIITTLIVLLLDCGIWFFNGKPGICISITLWLLNFFYFILCGIVPLIFLIFTIRRLSIQIKHKNFVRNILLIPQIILTIVSLSCYKTRWLFYINDNNEYVRGRLIWLQVIVSFFYLTSSTAIALYTCFTTKVRSQKKDAFFIVKFAIFPFVGGLLQSLWFGTALIWPSVAVAILMIYINLRDKQSSIDSLTGINNRSAFDRYVDFYLTSNSHQSRHYMILFDVDKFKMINDTYGHISGDIALQTVANALKTVYGCLNAFIGRYGGDEFVAVTTNLSEEQVKKSITDVSEKLESLVVEMSLPYKISLSAGYAMFQASSSISIKGVLASADEKMYNAKKLAKK